MTGSQSALIARVPEAESAVSDLRLEFDPSAKLGVPAHVTILYPFLPPQEISAKVLQVLAEIAASAGAFEFKLRECRSFPDALYLAPEPAEPFASLTRRVVDRFPEYPPYGGAYDGAIPHLTVAMLPLPEQTGVRSRLLAKMQSTTIDAICSEMVLIENSTGLWRPMHAFRLGIPRAAGI